MSVTEAWSLWQTAQRGKDDAAKDAAWRNYVALVILSMRKP